MAKITVNIVAKPFQNFPASGKLLPLFQKLNARIKLGAQVKYIYSICYSINKRRICLLETRESYVEKNYH